MNRIALILLSAAFIAAPVCARTLLVPSQVAIGGFGACIVRMAPQQSKKLMTLPRKSREEAKFLDTLLNANTPCLTKFASLTMRDSAIRGAIAQSLIIGDEARQSKLQSLPALSPVRAVPLAGEDFLTSFATCITKSEPAKSLALLKTEYRSPAENASVLALESALTGCIPTTVEYALNIPELRSHIAMAAYALSEPSTPQEAS